jgi:hypothetical protein
VTGPLDRAVNRRHLSVLTPEHLARLLETSPALAGRIRAPEIAARDHAAGVAFAYGRN